MTDQRPQNLLPCVCHTPTQVNSTTLELHKTDKNDRIGDTNVSQNEGAEVSTTSYREVWMVWQSNQNVPIRSAIHCRTKSYTD